MKRRTLARWLALTIAVLALSAPALCQVTVIFTRHAEKGATPPKDPPLTEAGKRRAEALASMLADSGVEAIYTTELQRTQQTAAVLAARVHVTPTVLPAKDTAALVNAIRADLDTVDVVHAARTVLTRFVGDNVAVVRSELNAAIAACERSNAECTRHAEHHAHCRLCANATSDCITACRDLIGALGD